MPVVIKTKNKATGTPASLEVGELAVNTTNGKLFVGSAVGGVITISDNLLPLDNTWTGTNTFTTLEVTTDSLIGDTLQINTGQLGPIGLGLPILTIQNNASVVGGYVANNEVLKANIQLGVAIPAIQFGNVINDGTVLSDIAGTIGLNTHLVSSGGAGSITPNAIVDEMVLLGANTGLYSRSNIFAVPTKRIFLSANGTITIAGGAQVQATGLPAVATACSTVYGSNGSITTTTPLNTMTTNQTTGDWKVTQTYTNTDFNASIELAQGPSASQTEVILQSGLNGFTICDGRFFVKRWRKAGQDATTGGLIVLANYAGDGAWKASVKNGTASEPEYNIQQEGGSYTGVKLGWGSTSWSSYSDERVKNITGTVEDATTMLSGFRTVYYTMKEDPSNVEKVGLIAQDVQAVIPCAVDTTSADDDTLSMRYTDMIPVLVKAIQELTARVEALEA